VAVCCVGEEPFSYGYGGTGKASTDCKFKDYGTTFGQGDVISACVVGFDFFTLPQSKSIFNN